MRLTKGSPVQAIYGITGAVLFTVALVYMPGDWWVKVLLWIGLGMVVQTHTIVGRER